MLEWKMGARPGEKNKRLECAKNSIKALHYQAEGSFSFQHFSALFTRDFSILAKSEDECLSDRQKVSLMLEKITVLNNELCAVKTFISSTLADDYTGAVNYFSEQVSRVHGPIKLQVRQRKKPRLVSSTQVSPRGGSRFGGRSCGKGRGRGRGGGGYGGHRGSGYQGNGGAGHS